MNIGIVTQKVVLGDGQGTINHAVAQAAVQRGHSVVLLAEEVAPELHEHPSVQWVRIDPGAWPTHLLRDQVFARTTQRYLHKHRTAFDVVMANGAITWAPADVNAMHFVHGAWLASPARVPDARPGPHAWYRDIYGRINAAWERRALRQARVAVAVSNLVKSQIEALDLGVAVETIPNGIDLTLYTPNGPAVDRASLRLPAGVPLAFFAGDIRIRLKNLDTVLRALQHVPALHLAVAGSTEGSPFPTMARRLGIADRVHFLGFRRDMPALMRTADVFVFPSRYETFSLVLLEAMASGTPVVTAATVGAADLVPPEAGIVIKDPNDVRALTRALQHVVESPARRQRMGHAARTAAERHPIAQTGDRYVDLFERLHARELAVA